MNDKSLCLFNPSAVINGTETVCAGLIASLREKNTKFPFVLNQRDKLLERGIPLLSFTTLSKLLENHFS